MKINTVRRRKSLLLFPIVMGLLLVIVACSGGAKDEVADAAPASSGTTSATATSAPSAATPTAKPAASTGGVPEPKQSGGTFIMIPDGGVGAWVGLNRSQAPEMLMYWGVTEQLFRPKGEELVGNWLAESWTMSSDLSTATVKLQEGVQFHNGNGELTAEDFAWSLNDTNAVVTPESIHGQAGDFAAFMGPAEAIDKYTVQLNFDSPEPRWTTLLFNQAGDAFGVFSKKLHDEKGADWMRENIIGTGPYSVEEAIRDDKVVLQATDSHWDKTAEAQTLRLIDVSETATVIAMLKSGEADWAGLPVRDLPALVDDGFKVAKTGRQNGVPLNMAGNYWEEVGAKSGDPLPKVTFVHDIPWVGNPFSPDDKNNPPGMDDMEQARLVRWAISMSVDRQLINDSLYGGGATEYHIGMFHPIDPKWDDKWRIEYDVTKAEEYLDQAGFPRDEDGVRFQMPIYSFTSVRDWAEIADATAGFLTEVGIEVSVFKVAYAIVRPSLVARATTTPATQWCRSDVYVPYDWVRGEEETSLTRGGFGCHMESPFILDVVQQVAAEPDPEKRIALNLTLADYLHHQQLKIGLIALPMVSVYNPKSIASWDMRPAPQGPSNSPERIVPVN